MLKILFTELLPFVFYTIGSVCFLVGTLVVIVRRLG